MRINKLLILAIAATLTAGCMSNNEERRRTIYGQDGKTTAYVEKLVVVKSKRLLKLVSNGQTLKEYKIALGKNPVGHKLHQGDGRTPEGQYKISAKKHNSQFHKSLRVSYPSANDSVRARQMGKSAGGDIYIHGGPRNNPNFKSKDWTEGCIAVTDKEIEEIFQYVGVGTEIVITP